MKIMLDLNLQNKVALVCGSTQGIGKASATALAHMGAQIVLVARDEGKLKGVCAELPAPKEQRHEYVVADFLEPENLLAKVEEKIGERSAMHILINNTGGPPGGPLFMASIDAFEKAFTAHLTCNHLLTQCIVPKMKEAGYGRIINIISTSVKTPLPNLGVSNTIRGAVASWSKTMANELGQFNITVNNVLPGATATQRLQSILETKAEKIKKSREEVEKEMKQEIPMNRFAQPEEVANAVAFLASPAASYINGINLPVDGGRTACL